jgi:hypothetical protein
VTAITAAQTKLGLNRIPDKETIPPWTIQDVDILMSHLCGHREERAIPERLALQTRDRIPDGEEADVTNPQSQKRPIKKYDDR